MSTANYTPKVCLVVKIKLCSQTSGILQVLGAKRKNLAGFSTATAQPHQGFIFTSDVIQQTPPGVRGKASRMVGAKCTLLARMDAYGQDPSGQAGEAMKVNVKHEQALLLHQATAAMPVSHYTDE